MMFTIVFVHNEAKTKAHVSMKPQGLVKADSFPESNQSNFKISKAILDNTENCLIQS